MNIGFDAKRAYHNGTGLGQYSRTLLHLLVKNYPEHEYFLFNPKQPNRFAVQGSHIHEVVPSGLFNKLFSSAWRSSWVKKDLKRLKIDLYHGLSHEIPAGIQQTGIKSIVTIHDLIHERHPEQYNRIDVAIYKKKFRYACKHADRIIAISEQTKKDIVDFYKISPDKISICYQSCNPMFSVIVSVAEKEQVRNRYGLPQEYFLYVGSIIERKNLLNIVKALFLLRNELKVPLVVIGAGGKYKQQVQDFIRQHKLEQQVIFLSDNKAAKDDDSYKTATAFPAIYQMAVAMIYPSFFEGFGMPVLEALCSRLPVITSNVSCMPETGGPDAYYVNPESAEEMAAGMKKIYSDKAFAAAMAEKGLQHAANFAPDTYAKNIMNIYKGV